MGMCAEDLKGRIGEAMRKKDTARRRWELVVRLVKVTFGDGNVTEEIAWVTMVLLPKGKRYYRVIGVVEVLWKV